MLHLKLFIKKPANIIWMFIFFATCGTSCKKFIEIETPVNQLITSTVFDDDLTAKAAARGLYGKIAYSGGAFTGGLNGLSRICGFSADELTILNNDETQSQFNENAILTTNNLVNVYWNETYSQIYNCNSLLEGLNNSSGLTPSLKRQLEGEGKFLRAYLHFYLLNLFGKIPYVNSTDYEKNTNAIRMEISEVYQLVIKDLIEAKELLSNDYSFSNNHRSRANKYAASALLSKVYLFNKNYPEAEAEASNVIATPLYQLTNLDNVFLIDSQEAIWQLENVPGETSTYDGNAFTGPETRTAQTMNKFFTDSFDPSDLRRQNWILEYDQDGVTRYASNKLKDNGSPPTLREASTVIRLGEIFLIRAEARAQQNKLTGANGAESDVNLIRTRAGLGSVTSSSKEGWLDLILDERKFELFVEWGSRWFDLKRFGKADVILGPLKSNWNTTDQLYPIPREETLVNPNMYQNPGYN